MESYGRHSGKVRRPCQSALTAIADFGKLFPSRSLAASRSRASVIPSQGAVLVAAEANWGALGGGGDRPQINRALKLFAEAVDRAASERNRDAPIGNES